MSDWYVDPVNGSASYSGDSWTLDLSGTDGQTYGTTKLTSASGGFTGKQGRYIRIVSAVRKIVAVVSDTEVTLDATYTSGTGRSFFIGGPLNLMSGLSTTYFVAGDRVKVPKTEAPTASGTMTFTNQSPSVVMDSGRIAIIDQCESGWVAAANITATHQTSLVVMGTCSLKLVPVTAFTTGKMAYKDLGAGNELDLSSFQGVSLFLYCNGTAAADSIRICLCSDATGDVVVDELVVQPLAGLGSSPVFARAFKAGGANLGAAIRSVAVYANLDPGTYNWYVDNIVAIKATSDPVHICHWDMLSLGDGLNDMWWGIKGFSSEIGVELLCDYYGTAIGSQSVYRREAAALAAAQGSVPVAGTRDQPCICSGGWDPSTDTQDGVTAWRLYQSSTGGSTLFALSKNGWLHERFCFQGRVASTSYVNHNSFVDCHFLHKPAYSLVEACFLLDLSATADYRFSELNLIRCRFTGGTYALQVSGPTTGNREAMLGWRWEDIKAYSNRGGFLFKAMNDFVCRGLESCNQDVSASAGEGLHFDDFCRDVRLFDVTLKDNADHGIEMAGALGGDVQIWNLTASGNANGTVHLASNTVTIMNGTLDATPFASVSQWGKGTLLKSGGVADTHAVRLYYGTLDADGSVRHTAAGVSWKFSPTNSGVVLRKKLASIAVLSGNLTTIGVYARRSDTGISGRLLVPGKQLAGIATDVTGDITVNADLWEQLTVTFTTSETGVIDVWFEAWGGTSYSVWVDDLSVEVA